VQRHTLVYTVILAGLLAAFFDLSRIASLGAIFYLVMDITIHWGVLRYLRDDVGAIGWIILCAIALDLIVLAAFVILKGSADPTIVWFAAGSIVIIVLFEKFYLGRVREAGADAQGAAHHG